MNVEELIDTETYSWNRPLLEQYLQPADVHQVLKIKLDMRYTVKSGYWTATHFYHDGEVIVRPEGSLEIKRNIWSLNILPKIKQFLWRVVSGALPTYTKLCTRGINIDPTCQRCCQDEETINHVLFTCPHATAMWRCSCILPYHVFTLNLEENLQALFDFMKSLSESESNRLLVFWILWLLWKSRNEYVFKKRNVHPIEDLRRAIDANTEWFRNVVLTNAESHDKLSSLQDGNLANEMESANIAGREALGFLIALQQTWIRGWRRVWFEGDNIELCNIINQVKENVDLGNLLCDIRHWMQLLLIAHWMCLSMFYHIPPVWLISFLYYPYTI
ncbi:hypothetical protein Bca52824_070580 [Brassica carinata]|uniref:Reverse transcriptase zinc-binding domain-containing protein n=1 Tax=Brassica carinata TaxID=52824 RepID=A0A8X7Q4G9_BRACI|nr:hypothetical protein Bca52824_070580 [Brassica carinata]